MTSAVETPAGLSVAELRGLRRGAMALVIVAYVAVFVDGLLGGASELMAMGRGLVVALVLAILARIALVALNQADGRPARVKQGAPATPAAAASDGTAEPAAAETRRMKD
jgi:hypothetical protein